MKPESKWEGPAPGLTKTNVDASYFTNGFTIVGEWYWIILIGVVYIATTKTWKDQVSPTLAEALRLRWCLQYA